MNHSGQGMPFFLEISDQTIAVTVSLDVAALI